MRWNCPHCGTNLAVADEKAGNGWSFSRCYKCAGFALVRRSDVTLIKVDRAPEGEPVLLPEAHENPTTLMSETATRNLARYASSRAATEAARAESNAHAAAILAKAAPTIQVTGGGSAKPVVRAATPRALANAATNALLTAANKVGGPQRAAGPSRTATTASPINSYGLPEPLPEEPRRGMRERLMPIAIGAAGMFTIGSGIYLYVQGQALFEKARAQANEAAPAKATHSDRDGDSYSSNENNNENERENGAPSEVIAAPTAIDMAASAATAPAATIAASDSAHAPSATAGSAMIDDQVHARAMAPQRTSAASASMDSAPAAAPQRTPAVSAPAISMSTANSPAAPNAHATKAAIAAARTSTRK